MTEKLIKFYKGYVLREIYNVLKEDGWTKKEVDERLKNNARINKSCKDMTKDELGELIRWSFMFGDTLGLNLDFPEDDLDNYINLEI